MILLCCESILGFKVLKWSRLIDKKPYIVTLSVRSHRQTDSRAHDTADSTNSVSIPQYLAKLSTFMALSSPLLHIPLSPSSPPLPPKLRDKLNKSW